MREKIGVVLYLVYAWTSGGTSVNAQPPERQEVAPAPVAQVNAQADVQRAEASVQVMSFAMETLRSQSTPEGFSKWPIALRDTLPYWLEYQPFSAWSPEVRQFAMKKFRELANDPNAETFAPEAENKAAIAKWLQEAEPFRDVNLRFHLVAVFSVAGIKNGTKVGGEGAAVNLPGGGDAKFIQVLGRFLSSLSAAQKAELFANKMRLPISRLSQEQKAIFETFFNNGIKVDNMPIHQLPEAKFSVDFQFKMYARRVVNGKKDFFEAQIARPFDYRAGW